MADTPIIPVRGAPVHDGKFKIILAWSISENIY